MLYYLMYVKEISKYIKNLPKLLCADTKGCIFATCSGEYIFHRLVV